MLKFFYSNVYEQSKDVNPKTFDSINEIIDEVFEKSIVNWKIETTENGSDLFIWNKSKKILVHGFEPGKGMVDLIEKEAW